MSIHRRKAPIRTCVGCGERAPQDDLVRFTHRSGALVPDDGKRRPGRGGYLHRDERCGRRFVKRKPWIRSLRQNVGKDRRHELVTAVVS